MPSHARADMFFVVVMGSVVGFQLYSRVTEWISAPQITNLGQGQVITVAWVLIVR